MMKTALVALAVLSACGTSDPNNGNPVVSNPDLVALSQWKMTMTLADFDQANMSQTWSTMTSTDGQLCVSCHSEYGSSDDQLFFDQVVQNQDILLRFFAVANAKISVNDAAFNAAANHLAPVPMHPAFDVSTATGLQALRTFYMLTCGHAPSLCP